MTGITRLLSIMRKLRDPETSCAWDRAQSFATIVPHTIEEAYEVADAVARGDMEDLRDELGDLLFQVVFQAQIAEENGAFAFDDVAAGIADKLEARHPHIFGEGSRSDRSQADQADDNLDVRWETIKAAERASKGSSSAMDGVALALPALMRASKLQKRAARDGFDWPDPGGAEGKIVEEIEELRAATSDQIFEECGDLLFAAVNLVRAYGVDAEEALRHGNAKFERRYRGMEVRAGGTFAALSLSEQETLWQAVKADEH